MHKKTYSLAYLNSSRFAKAKKTMQINEIQTRYTLKIENKAVWINGNQCESVWINMNQLCPHTCGISIVFANCLQRICQIVPTVQPTRRATHKHTHIPTSEVKLWAVKRYANYSSIYITDWLKGSWVEMHHVTRRLLPSVVWQYD